MTEFKPQNRIVVGDDIQHLLINNLENKKTAYLKNNPITIARERLKIALYFFIVFFVIFSVRNTFISVFPGDVISEPQHSLALSVKKPLPDIYDRSGKKSFSDYI